MKRKTLSSRNLELRFLLGFYRIKKTLNTKFGENRTVTFHFHLLRRTFNILYYFSKGKIKQVSFIFHIILSHLFKVTYPTFHPVARYLSMAISHILSPDRVDEDFIFLCKVSLRLIIRNLWLPYFEAG